MFDTRGQIIRIRFPAGEIPTRLRPGNLPMGEALSWNRRGGRLQVRLRRGGPQTLSLVDLKGKWIAAATAGGSGPVSLAIGVARGMHLLVWESGPHKSAALVPL